MQTLRRNWQGWVAGLGAALSCVGCPAPYGLETELDEEDVSSVETPILTFCSDGILSADGTTCCAPSCGTCGGSGCSSRSGGAASCCQGTIEQSGRSCAYQGAPCTAYGDPWCDDGIPSADGQFCCPSECGACGGAGCSTRPGGTACCTSGITQSCKSSEAPCAIGQYPNVPTQDHACTNGTKSALSDGTQVCCPLTCTDAQGNPKCGGSGCSSLVGGSANCCIQGVADTGKDCTSNGAPCVLQKSFAHPGLLSTQSEVDQMTQLATQSGTTQQGALAPMLARLSAWTGSRAVAIVEVASSGTTLTETAFKQDAQVLNELTLLWLSGVPNACGDVSCNARATALANSWANTFSQIQLKAGDTHPNQIWLESAWGALMWAIPAELLRHAKVDGVGAGWPEAEAETFGNFLTKLANGARNYTYPALHSTGRANNRGVTAATAVMAVGVYNDSWPLYAEGLQRWKDAVWGVQGNPGAIVPVCDGSAPKYNTTNDAKHWLPEFEDREDCGHAQYTMAAASQGAAIAWRQGDDLYATPGSACGDALLGAGAAVSWLFRNGTLVLNNVDTNDTADTADDTLTRYLCQCRTNSNLTYDERSGPYAFYEILRQHYPSNSGPDAELQGLLTDTACKQRPGVDTTDLFQGIGDFTHAGILEPGRGQP